MNTDGVRHRCRLCGESRSNCRVAQEATLLRHTFSAEPQVQLEVPVDDRDTSNQAASEPETPKPRPKPRKLARLSKSPRAGIERAPSPAAEQVGEQQKQRRRSQSAPKLYKPPIDIFRDPDAKDTTTPESEESIGQAKALREVTPNPRPFLRRRSSSLPSLKPRPAVSTTTTTATTPSAPSTPYKDCADPFASSSRRSSQVLALEEAQAQHKSKNKPHYRLVLNPQGKAALGTSRPPSPAIGKAQEPLKMRKTLLLCFIHGFKGGDDTFGNFPEHLRVLVSHALPKIAVATITYPKYETRGDLHECVARFKEWLQNKVIDLEVANGTPSPTIDPSVHTLLVGHSMGGIVAAETVLSILADKPVPPSTTSVTSEDPSTPDNTSSFMFPYIQGILAFDTPYLGIAPSVVAHEAEGHWNAATAAYSTYSQVASAFFRRPGEQQKAQAVEASKMLPAPPGTPITNADADAAAVPAWQRWGKYAMFAGAAGAVVAGGAAAYKKREQLSEGWQWVGSHLEFVGCLARGQELQKRINATAKLEESHGFGFANLYTCLGAAVQGKSYWSSDVLGEQRTFCTIPKSDLKKYFFKMTNDAARAETWAHMSMFSPKQHPGYYGMSEKAKELIVAWASGEWYEEAEVDPNANVNTIEDGDDVEMVEKPEENPKLEENAQPEDNAEPDAEFERVEKTEPQTTQ